MPFNLGDVNKYWFKNKYNIDLSSIWEDIQKK